MPPPQRTSRPGTGLRRSVGAALVIVAAICGADTGTASPAGPRYAQAAAPPTAQEPRLLTGSEAWAAMLDNTITGTTPDGDYAEFFRSDGSFVHVDRDGSASGNWSLKDQRVCFSYPDEDEVECRRPELLGQHGAFTDVDGARYTFELLPGDPKGL